MVDQKLIDEVIQALECCIKHNCHECPLNKPGEYCVDATLRLALHMQRAIKFYYGHPKYQPTKEQPVKHTQIEHLYSVG